jgi:cell division protein FtsB
MPTRLKRPSRWRALAITTLLIGFQGYLGYSALRGQFGIESQQQMQREIGELEAKSAMLKAEIDSYRHRSTLFDPRKLDPDILTERARALLNMAQADDIVVMVDAASGAAISKPAIGQDSLPVSGSQPQLADSQLQIIPVPMPRR